MPVQPPAARRRKRGATSHDGAAGKAEVSPPRYGRQAHEVSLNKLPWKAQVGVFLAVAVAAVGGFYWYCVQAGAGRDGAAADEARRACRSTSTRAWRPRDSCRSSGGRSTELQARLDSLRAVLPEEKDVSDLLRRLQTLATQSNLQIKGFKPAPIVTKQTHAEWPIKLELDGTYHNLGLFFDRVSKFPRIINVSGMHIKAKDKPRPRLDDQRRVHGDDLRADRSAGGKKALARQRSARANAAGRPCEGAMTRSRRARTVPRSSARVAWTAATRTERGRARRASSRGVPAAAQTPRRPLAPRRSTTSRYNADGRRDPFVSLLARGSEGEGLAGRTTGLTASADSASDEVSVRGVMQSHGGYVAMVQGPDNKTYRGAAERQAARRHHPGRLPRRAIVILQDVNDPLSLVKQKEVRKMLRGVRGREVGLMRRYGIRSSSSRSRRSPWRAASGSRLTARRRAARLTAISSTATARRRRAHRGVGAGRVSDLAARIPSTLVVDLRNVRRARLRQRLHRRSGQPGARRRTSRRRRAPRMATLPDRCRRARRRSTEPVSHRVPQPAQRDLVVEPNRRDGVSLLLAGSRALVPTARCARRLATRRRARFSQRDTGGAAVTTCARGLSSACASRSTAGIRS